MIIIKDYEEVLNRLGAEYFIEKIQYVPNIMSWAREHSSGLSEPYNPMKLLVDGSKLTMVIQEEIDESMTLDVIKNLSLRWTLKDNVTDMWQKMNTIKKRLAYCYLKEYARSMEKTDGDELNEDEWVIEEMDFLGFFRE